MSIIRSITVLTILVGILGWILTFSSQSSNSPLQTAWMITFIANPIGIILGIILIRKNVKYGLPLTVINILLMISFGPMWFLGDLIALLRG